MKIQENIPLAPYTTFKIGGPARFFCEARGEDEILEALEFAQGKNLPVFVLGGGSNVLVSDNGFEGLVMKILNTQYSMLDAKIDCGAGCALGKIVSESAKAGLAGLEWAAGIPGTVGGAVRGNAGAESLGGTMRDITEEVRALEIPASGRGSDKPDIQVFKKDECKFDYRDSIFKQKPNLIILSAIFGLERGNRAEIEKKIGEILTWRKERQPMEYPSPGSFFKNPVTKSEKLIKQFERDTGKKLRGDKIPAPYLIERAGLKGKRIGGAEVSEKHSNFIVNTGNATAENVIILMGIIKTKVRNKFGVQLEEEVQYVGF